MIPAAEALRRTGADFLRIFFKTPESKLEVECDVANCLYKMTISGGINEQIRDKEVRLIGEHGEQLGIMSAKDALKAGAGGRTGSGIKVAPMAKPPVCKIIDYGKYRYEMARKEKEARKKQKTIEVKNEVRCHQILM